MFGLLLGSNAHAQTYPAPTYGGMTLFGKTGYCYANGASPVVCSKSPDVDTAVAGSAALFFVPTYYGNAATGVPTKFNRLQVGTHGGANIPQSPSDWANTVWSNSTSLSQVAAISTIGGIGVTGAARSSDYYAWNPGSASGGVQGVAGLAYCNDIHWGHICAGNIGWAVMDSGVTGIALGAQDTVSNGSTTTDITPFSGVISTMTIAHLATAGPDPDGLHHNNATAAYVVGPSGSAALFRKGIVIQNGTVDPAVGNGGAGVAAEFARGMDLRWVGSGGTVDLYITTSPTAGLIIPSGDLDLGAGGNTRWLIDHTTGNFYASADNTYDIGASAFSRPKNVYVAGNITLGGALTASGNIAGPTVVLSPSVNTRAIYSTGYSLTGSSNTPLVDLSGTWNTTGIVNGFLMNITNTASGAGSRIMSLQVGGVEKFGIAPSGLVTVASGVNALNLPTSGTVRGSVCQDTSGNLYVKTTTGACL